MVTNFLVIVFEKIIIRIKTHGVIKYKNLINSNEVMIQYFIFIYQELIQLIEITSMTEQQSSEYSSPSKAYDNKKLFDNSENKFFSASITKGFFNENNQQQDYDQHNQNKEQIKQNQSKLKNNKRRRRQLPKLQPYQHKEKVEVEFNTNKQRQERELDTTQKCFQKHQQQEQEKKQIPKKEAIKKQTLLKNQKEALLFQDDDDEEEQQQNKNNQEASNRNGPEYVESNQSEEISNQDESIEERNQDYFSFENVPKLKEEFLNPLSGNVQIKLEINRNNSGFNTFWPEFHANFNEGRYLASCKKTSSKPSSTFIVSLKKDHFEQNILSYCGKMKSNVLGDIYNIFGPGLNPDKAQQSKISPRELLATVVFETSFFSAGKPREFSVYIKKHQYGYYKDLKGVKMYDDQIPLNDLYNCSPENQSKIDIYKNRKPIWKEDIGGYMLNFRGRVGCASIKNFILEKEGEENARDAILFGKLTENRFNFDVTSPMSPFVAFCIALTAFDSRMMCE